MLSTIKGAQQADLGVIPAQLQAPHSEVVVELHHSLQLRLLDAKRRVGDQRLCSPNRMSVAAEIALLLLSRWQRHVHRLRGAERNVQQRIRRVVVNDPCTSVGAESALPETRALIKLTQATSKYDIDIHPNHPQLLQLI